MKFAFTLLTIAIFAVQAKGQLISSNGASPLNRIPVEIASDVPQKLQGDASLTFDDLDIFFDGGSHGAEFHRHDGGKLILFFPHSGYWTTVARKERVQPVAVLTQRNDKQILVEIKPDSKLNQRIVGLIDADIASGRHSLEKLATLKRVRESILKRSWLKEIADRIDFKTGDLKLDEDPFGGSDSFERRKEIGEPCDSLIDKLAGERTTAMQAHHSLSIAGMDAFPALLKRIDDKTVIENGLFQGATSQKPTLGRVTFEIIQCQIESAWPKGFRQHYALNQQNVVSWLAKHEGLSITQLRIRALVDSMDSLCREIETHGMTEFQLQNLSFFRDRLSKILDEAKKKQ